jgi:hypothetical protein
MPKETEVIHVIAKRPDARAKLCGTSGGRNLYEGDRFTIPATLIKDGDDIQIEARKKELKRIANVAPEDEKAYLKYMVFAAQWMRLDPDYMGGNTGPVAVPDSPAAVAGETAGDAAKEEDKAQPAKPKGRRRIE